MLDETEQLIQRAFIRTRQAIHPSTLIPMLEELLPAHSTEASNLGKRKKLIILDIYLSFQLHCVIMYVFQLNSVLGPSM